MGTALRDVYDLFMQTVTDYRLTDLFNSSETNFETYLQAWLELAIVDFYSCDQNLEFDDTTKEFPVVLNRPNKVILATLMTKYWLQKSVNDITQMNLHIMDRDFKVASEAQNLREKLAAFNGMKETCSQLLNDYAYRRNDWTSWNNQLFSGSA